MLASFKYFCGLVLLFFAANSALAQTLDKTPDKKPDKTPAAINWIISCASSAQSITLTCSMAQRIADSKSGQVLMTVSVQSQKTSGASAVLINLAHGFFLADGLKLQVDEGALVAAPFQTSGPQGLVSAIPMPPDLLSAMQTGAVLKVTATQYNPRNALTLPVSLAGFAAAYEKLTTIR